MFWAWPDEEEQLKIPGMRAIYEAIEGTHAEAEIMAAHRSWSEPPATVDGFDPFERREFPTTHVLPAARLADLYATFSDVVSLPASHPSVVARPHQAAVARTPRDVAPSSEDRRRPLRRSVS